MLFTFHSVAMPYSNSSEQVAPKECSLFTFMGDLSSFTDGSAVRINDLGNTSAPESSTVPRRHTFGNDIIESRAMQDHVPAGLVS